MRRVRATPMETPMIIFFLASESMGCSQQLSGYKDNNNDFRVYFSLIYYY